jgi:hypothetical protein
MASSRLVLCWIAVGLGLAVRTHVQAQLWSKYSLRAEEGGKVGAMTLLTGSEITTPISGLSTSKGVSSYGLLGSIWQRQLVQSGISNDHQKASRVGSGYRNFALLNSAPEFPQMALAQESNSIEQITPVAEPGTRIAGVLAAGFLIWQSGRHLLSRLVNPSWFRYTLVRCNEILRLLERRLFQRSIAKQLMR